jgi:sensor histidine kinase YesM
MSWKYVPFAGFFLFTLLTGIVYYILVPAATFPEHLYWFLGQWVILLTCWFIILAIARLLDKRLPYRRNFTRRVFFQVSSSAIVLLTLFFIAYQFLKPYLHSAATDQVLALGSIILIMIIVLMNVGVAAGTFFKQWQLTTAAKATAENEKRKTELELIQTKQRQAEMEMRALRAQMNPHFIFNSLNSINKYILKNDHANASRYLTRFAKLIRLILDNSNSKEVALSDELDALKLYIEMESLRFTSKFEYEIIVAPDISADTLQVPPLIIQPYVENAIWHGLLHKEQGGQLSVTVEKVKEDMLQCTIEDNGIGRKRASELKSKSATNNKSLGMKLTEERIVMLNQYTSLHASISIIDLENERGEASGTKVILKIPV